MTKKHLGGKKFRSWLTMSTTHLAKNKTEETRLRASETASALLYYKGNVTKAARAMRVARQTLSTFITENASAIRPRDSIVCRSCGVRNPLPPQSVAAAA